MNKQTENEFLEEYDSSAYEKPSIAVDVILFTIENDELKVLLIDRDEMPYAGEKSLPGVLVRMDETLDQAAMRAINQKTSLKDIYSEQLFTWGDLKRDPRMRIVSVSYLALVPYETLIARSTTKNMNNFLYSVDDLIHSDRKLAFDHLKMISYGRERIKNKAEYIPIAFELLPEKFTLPQLQKVYEILLGRDLYKANFRKKIQDLVEETEEYTSGDAHRPSKLYVRKQIACSMRK